MTRGRRFRTLKRFREASRNEIKYCVRTEEEVIIMNGKCQIIPKEEICHGCTYDLRGELGDRV